MNKYLPSGGVFYPDDQDNEIRFVDWQRFYKVQDVDSEIARLNARIAELELSAGKSNKEIQSLRGQNARVRLYLAIAEDRLEQGNSYQGGSIDCDYEHPIHEKITEICSRSFELKDRYRLRPRSEWTDDMGDVLWFFKSSSGYIRGAIPCTHFIAPDHYTHFQIMPPLPDMP